MDNPHMSPKEIERLEKIYSEKDVITMPLEGIEVSPSQSFMRAPVVGWTDDPKLCLETRPKRVALVALGPSNQDFVHHMTSTNHNPPFEEIWVVNRGMALFKTDKCFVMDDLRELSRDFPEYGRFLRESSVPLITSVAYPEFPMAVEFPIREICKFIQDDFFTTTVGFMLGWALYTDVEDIYLYGCDFWYPSIQLSEEGSQCMAYLLGIAQGMKLQGKKNPMRYHISPHSTALGAHKCVQVKTESGALVGRRPIYGYHDQPFIKTEEGEKVEIPDAEKYSIDPDFQVEKDPHIEMLDKVDKEKADGKAART